MMNNIGASPILVLHVFDCWMNGIVFKIKVDVFTDDYGHVRKLFETGKSGLLAELTFQILWVTSIMTLVSSIHLKFLASGTLSRMFSPLYWLFVEPSLLFEILWVEHASCTWRPWSA